ncbi:MAG: PSD1 domain-containing protein [Chloroflexi bacterium]|nr:PSD1 domain-containing protein [Chloroflexota bacterium]
MNRHWISGRSILLGAGLLAAQVGAGCLWAGLEPEAAGLEFFEKKIRPVLVEHCFQCHSQQSEKIKGGFRLDTREDLRNGGDSGPAIIPGDPEKSLLIKAVRYLDENLQMPPKNKKLSTDQISDLEAWVQMGAPDPRTNHLSSVASPSRSAAPAPAGSAPERHSTASHWAFKPVRRPPAPAMRNRRWVQTPIDQFVLAKLEEKGLAPSRQADKWSLIRRATFDLTGLPPLPEDVAAFLADKSPGAFAKVVERLLGSPHYGECWGRHWLDVARYADTKGYVFEEERRFPYSYTYRDYVIRSFNEDLPFDQFIVEQIAADLLPLGDDKRPLAALGFLTLGRRFLNNQHDIIDDRIDVVSRGMMGLTVACARCHDHKYDPIPSKDYYSLYGIFASCSEPAEKPLLGDEARPAAYAEYLAERAKRTQELRQFEETKQTEALATLRQQTGEYLLAAYDTRQLADQSKAEGLARERKLDAGVVRRWIQSLEKWGRQPHPIFTPWFAFAALPENEFSAHAPELAVKFASNQEASAPLNPLVAQAFAGEPPASMKEVSQRYGKLFQAAEKEWQEAMGKSEIRNPKSPVTNRQSPILNRQSPIADRQSPIADRQSPVADRQSPVADHSAQISNLKSQLASLPDAAREAVRQVLYASDAPSNLPAAEIVRLFDVPTRQKNRALQRKLDELDATHAGSPPRAMSLQDNPTPHSPRVFVRGNPSNPGSEVPRQFLEILAGPDRQPFQKGSGRLELARAIASPNNPLTARVIVNRVWLHHFGSGLIRTPSDFGLRSEPPTHPELLDYLAGRFMEEGWSLKKLHRLILLSSVYQQSSEDQANYAQVDPANQWLWKMSRRRLEFEATRDTLLTVAGQLDSSVGGRAVDITTEPFSRRRTVYGFIERQNLPGLFRTFDFASPDTTSPQRFATTVPQQALFMINSPFVVQQARGLLRRPEFQSERRPERRIKALYQIAYQRSPSAGEVRLALHFLEGQATAPARAAEVLPWQYGYGGYDDAAQRVAQFQPLPHFTGQAWQGGDKLPDDKLGWVLLNAEGGHAGNDPQHAAIRRWTAPRAGSVSISGTLGHGSESGDGVQGRIVSSRQGELGTWTVQHGKEPAKVERLEVQRGEAIDFLVDCRAGVDSDSFTWAPVIKMLNSTPPASGSAAIEWDARQDFSGPKESPKPLDPWEKYVQVLLMSNELVFVD